VDSFARAGFVAVAPDLFNGKPAPMDLNNPAFNQTTFLAQHDTPATDPIVAAGVSFLRTQLGAKKVAVTGYCFGGRYAIRSVSKVGALGADVAFAAHPSVWQNPELGNVTQPLGVGLAGKTSRQHFSHAILADLLDPLLQTAMH
jgi:dienelactone hydrolase